MRRTKPFRWNELRQIPKADHENREGFPSYSRTIEEDVVNVLMTGTTANAFYVKAKEKVVEMLSVLDNCEDLDFLAKAIVYARENGYMREIPVAATALLSKKSPELFKRTVHRVCRNPHDWQKFIDICRSKAVRQGLGRALKREIIRALSNMPVYHAIKYPRAVKDMIRIARPNELVNPVVIKYIMEGRHDGDEQFEALYRLKHAESEREIVRCIEEGRLPYEVVTGSVPKMTQKVWEALLYQAPYFNLLRNLNNFIRNGVLDKPENLEYVVEKLCNREAIRKSKLFPFRFYIAYRMLEDFRYVDGLKAALESAMEVSVENVPELDGRVAIAPDVSGSMDSSMTGDYSVVQCCDVVGVFAGAMIKKCKKTPLLLPFDNVLREDIAQNAYSKETMLEIATAFGAHGGTSLSAPVEWLLKNGEEVDYFIAFTDNEEWVGRSFVEALSDYIRRVNPDVKVYLVTLLPYRDYPVPDTPEFRNVRYVFGWSDYVLRYIASNTEEQVQEARNITL